MSLPVFASAVLVLVYFVWWYMERRSRVRYWNQLPSLGRSVFTGNIASILAIYSKKSKYPASVYVLERIVGYNHLFQREGLHAFWIGPLMPIVPLMDPDAIEAVLSSGVSLEKSYEYGFLHEWLGLGLLTSQGAKWRGRRKLLTPCFHFRILEDFLPAFDEQARVLVTRLRREADVDITPLVTLCTLDIVCETVMGARIGAQGGANSDYVTAIHNLGDFFNQRTIRPWLFSDFLFSLTAVGRGFGRDLKTIHSFTDKVIREKKEAVLSKMKRDDEEESKNEDDEEGQPRKKRQALMDLLLDQFFDGQRLTEEDIKEEVETFMFAGHDTTAGAITYALYCIGLYPEVQKKVEEELESIFGGDVERRVQMDDARAMKYMECVIKESQRLFPSVPVIGRKLHEDITHNGFVVPKGTEVHCNIISLHRRPDLFPDPERFDPDRFFLPENVRNRHPYAFVPFSAGPRNCIGQKFALLELKVIVSCVLRHFRVVSLQPRDRVHFKMEFTLKPAEPILLRFIPRN